MVAQIWRKVMGFKHNSTAAELQHCISEVCIEDAPRESNTVL